jgi:magnesium-transporting ATPase (P-type)
MESRRSTVGSGLLTALITKLVKGVSGESSTSSFTDAADEKSARRRREETAQRQRDLGSSYVEHFLSIEQLAEIHSDSYIDVTEPANSSGLSTFEARKRLLDGGANLLPRPKGISNWQLFYHQYFYKFWLLLLGAALLSMSTYFIKLAKGGGASASLSLVCAVILFGVVVIMSVLSCWQERKSIDILSGLELILPHNCHVIRDCQEASSD